MGLLSKGALLVAAALVAGTRRLFVSEPSAVTVTAGEQEPSWLARWLREHLWRTARYFLIFLVVLGLGGFVLAASGVIPIKASSGHWPITHWLLQFSKERSIATHTLGMESPPLDEWRLILRGAGAYHTNCRGCHGSPEVKSPRVVQEMLPPPPYLPTTVPNWDSTELFYIVKHGLKFTGMPAWPALQRDDEVWAMVAFLRRMPEVDAESYRRLVKGETPPTNESVPLEGLLGSRAEPPPVVDNCIRCHGRDGLGRGVGAFPKLAGQSTDYFLNSLRAYAREQRHSGVMEPLVTGLTDEEMQQVAKYYASLPAASRSATSDEERRSIERGAQIAQSGIPTQRVPACIECHGPANTPRNSAYPSLTGQYADYLQLQLELFKENKRGGSAYAHLMQPIATRLTAAQMRDVALYFESLQSAGTN